MNSNLMPIEEVNSRRTREEHSRDSRKAGIASGEARRKRKAFKEQIDYFLSLPFPDMVDRNGNNMKDVFKNFGIDEEEIDNQMAMVLSMWKAVINKGDVQAFNSLRDTVGDKPTDKVQNINMSYEEYLKQCESDEEY